MRNYLIGLTLPFRGCSFMSRHWSLWTYAWQPVVLTLLIAFVVGVLGIWGGMTLVSSLQPEADAGWSQKLLAIGTQVGVVILAIATSVTLYIVLQGIFCAIFFSLLARQTEYLLGTSADSMTDPPLIAQTQDALRAGLKILIANILLVVLNVIPFVGSAAALALGAYIDTLVLGSEFIGYPLELRGVRWLQRQQYAKQHLGETLGLGTTVTLVMFVPVIGAVLQATAVVGSVLLYHDLHPTNQPAIDGSPRMGE